MQGIRCRRTDYNPRGRTTCVTAHVTTPRGPTKVLADWSVMWKRELVSSTAGGKQGTEQ